MGGNKKQTKKPRQPRNAAQVAEQREIPPGPILNHLGRMAQQNVLLNSHIETAISRADSDMRAEEAATAKSEVSKLQAEVDRLKAEYEPEEPDDAGDDDPDE